MNATVTSASNRAEKPNDAATAISVLSDEDRGRPGAMSLPDAPRLGSGATVWGANAINSVINGISRRARDTQGTLLHGEAGNSARGRAEITKEHHVKAAYLCNFPKFVECPPARFADAQRPITIGIGGDNPFGDELAKTTAGRKINGRDLVIRPVASEAEVRSAGLKVNAQLRKLATTGQRRS